MIRIDGSFGEGGGQILRSSLALSIVTGTPVRIENIRAGRRKPGLMRQHLTAVRAARDISCGQIIGDEIGSTELEFEPGEVYGGDFKFSIGTAGSTTLVLQTVLLPLALAKTSSRLVLEGGTHNPFAPPFDFLVRAYLPLLRRMGLNVDARLERAGFFPAGGGRAVIDIEPASGWNEVNILSRGELRRRSAMAVVSNLPRSIGERELKVVQRHLGWSEDELGVVEVERSVGPGNIVTIEVAYENVTEMFTGFGEVGRSAEAVANHAVQQCQRYLKSDAPVGEHLTDQLMLPMAIAGSGSFRSTGLSLHAQTHLELIHKFLDVRIETEKHDSGGVTLSVT
ncbi:MAG: RNA 3'-terminal phosphate cyclase [Phycisphaerae bacterium]|nr:MAG: RNA 3'-terminal phosphate cyclase [Phycisphaerae bacterium]